MIIVLFILLILTALVVSARAIRGAGVAVLGGALLARSGRPASGGDEGPTGHHPRDLHPVGVALERYARGLGPEHIIAVHPLDRDRYGPLEEPAQHGGAAKKASPKQKGSKSLKPKKPWAEYQTWEELHEDQGAVAEYIAQRSEALNNPEFDWGPVLREIGPRLAENREYIGIINAEKDGKTLRVSASEASPIEAGDTGSETAFASVPAELVKKYAERPALFLFHTHPEDPRCNPLPSSHDLSTAIYLAATGRFAANVVVSRYGAFAYALNWDGYKAINEAHDWNLALSNFSHDVVASHEAIRSWSAHSLEDQLHFYSRHRLLAISWPSPQMVADSKRYSYLWDLEKPIEHELIEEHREDIRLHEERLKGKPSRNKGAPPGQGKNSHLQGSRELDLGFD